MWADITPDLRIDVHQGFETFFSGWDKIGKIIVLSVCAYISLVFLLRISGKRTLAKMNIYDFVFVVALGSILASTILSNDVSLADGVAALMALIILQVVLSLLCVTSSKVDSILNGVPTLVYYKGEFLWKAMKSERVSPEEIRAAARNDGNLSMDGIDSVVLETDGTFSVVNKSGDHSNSALQDVPGHATYRDDEPVRQSSGPRRRQD